MPTDAYIQHLENRLASVDAKLARAKAAIDEGGPADQAKALEEERAGASSRGRMVGAMTTLTKLS
jgi:hypothetical protein